MKVQVDYSVLYPANMAPPAEQKAQRIKANDKLQFFNQLSEQSKLRAEFAHNERQYQAGRTTVLDSIMPRETIDPHLFSRGGKPPSFAAGSVWPTQREDGMHSGMKLIRGNLMR